MKKDRLHGAEASYLQGCNIHGGLWESTVPIGHAGSRDSSFDGSIDRARFRKDPVVPVDPATDFARKLSPLSRRYLRQRRFTIIFPGNYSDCRFVTTWAIAALLSLARMKLVHFATPATALPTYASQSVFCCVYCVRIGAFGAQFGAI